MYECSCLGVYICSHNERIVHRDFYSRVCNVTLPTVIQPFHGCNGYYNNEFNSNKKLK